MEKDLRDAYKALKLLRADLTRTRAEKGALAEEAAALRSDNARLRAEQQPSERTTEPLDSEAGDDHQPQSQMLAAKGERQRESDDPEENQREDEAANRVEEMVREKLALLANLYSLKSKLDAQAAAMLAQQAAFAHERDELCMQLEELGDQLAQLQAHVLDVEHEKQFAEEKYDFLVTELQLLKQQRGASADSESDTRSHDDEDDEDDDAQEEHTAGDHELASEAAVDVRELMDAKLKELEAIRDRLEAERKALQNQREQPQSPPEQEELADESAKNGDEGHLRRDAAIRALEEQVRVLKAANAELTETVETLKREIDTSASRYEAELEALRQEKLKDVEAGVAAARAAAEEQTALYRERLELAIQTHEHEAADARVALDEAKNREAELLGLMTEAKAAMRAEFEAQLQHLETDLSGQRVRYEALECEHEEQREATERLQREAAEAHVRLQNTSAALEASERDASSLRENATGLATELDECRKAIASLTSEAESAAEAQEQLRGELEQLRRDHARILAAKEEELQLQFAETLSVQRAQHEKLAKSSAMEVKALLQETRHLAQALKQKEDALAQAQSAAAVATAALHAAKQQADATNALLQRQVSVLETQLMAIEDRRCAEEDAYDAFAVADDGDTNARAWTFIERKVREFGHFLPQLQNFAYFVDSALCECAANARALEALSLQHSERRLTHDVVSFLRFVGQLQRGVGSASHVKQARRLHCEVLEVLSHWYECPEDEEIPAPPFGIASREASLVLQNWTSDKSRRAAASRWLARMEAVAAAGAAMSRSSSSSSVDETASAEDLAADGSTLELQQMTSEVKQAFLVLIVPILRRNPAIYVRVFTRRVGVSDAQPSDANWEMKIHVQLRRGSWANGPSSSSGRKSVGASLPSRSRPPPLELTGSYPVTPLHSDAVPTPTSAHKLQIIQERLQHMQKR